MDTVIHSEVVPPTLAPEVEPTIRAAQEELARAVQVAGLTNDPLRHALLGLSAHLGAMHRLFVDGSLTLSRAIDDARRPISKEEMAALERAATRGFANQAASFVRAFNWRTLAIASGVLFSVAATGLGAGYFWGRANERAHISAIQDELRAAFSGGVRTAEIWRGLVRFNPAIDESLKDCKPVPQPGGAAACSMTVWTAPRKEPK